MNFKPLRRRVGDLMFNLAAVSLAYAAFGREHMAACSSSCSWCLAHS